MSIIELLESYFKEQKWTYSQVKGENTFLFGINGENGKIQCTAQVSEEAKFFAFYTTCGFNAPENKRSEIAELLTRLNHDESFGNFEMDFEDGEIRFKTSVFYDHIEPNTLFIETFIIQNLISMDDSLPALSGMVFNNLTPLQAYKLVEEAQTSN
jgi:hypothetical protein